MSTLLNAVGLAPGQSASATLSLTPPLSGVAFVLGETGDANPSAGVQVSVARSLDGSLFSDSVLVDDDVSTGGSGSFITVSAPGCTAIRATVINGGSDPVTVTLQAVQYA